MRQQDANTIAAAVIDILVMAPAGMADFTEGPAMERIAYRLVSLPKVREWLGYHLEAMQDNPSRHDELSILNHWLRRIG